MLESPRGVGCCLQDSLGFLQEGRVGPVFIEHM